MSRRRGYTIMEVMMSLGVLAVGATGVMALQKVTLYGNAQARTIAKANAIALGWIERLRADAVVWNGPPNLPDDLGETTWLNQVTGTWFTPAAVVGLGSPSYDVVGAEMYAPGVFEQAFCTHVRLTRVYPTLVRAEVRVFWDKQMNPITCPPNVAEVESGWIADTGANNHRAYGFVYLTSGIYQNQFAE